jgi:hypothetical protein
MKNLLAITLLATLAATAEEPPVAQDPAAPRAWLGLQLSKPDASLTAQLPLLPPGIGFVVHSIDKDGPAARAGLREHDILWKIGDQMLVNEAQLAILLRLHQPGEAISLSGFRAGNPLTLDVKLGIAPAACPSFPGELVDSAVLPGVTDGPIRVVNPADQTATYTTDEGSAEVRRENSVYHVIIKDAAGNSIHEGVHSSTGDMKHVPREWQRRVIALCRGLDHVLDGQIAQPRQPRPRVVPPTASSR